MGQCVSVNATQDIEQQLRAIQLEIDTTKNVACIHFHVYVTTSKKLRGLSSSSPEYAPIFRKCVDELLKNDAALDKLVELNNKLQALNNVPNDNVKRQKKTTRLS